MGFSWSSYIAQTTMTDVCLSAGLFVDTQLSYDLKAPVSRTRWGLATDDVVLLSVEPDAIIADKLARLDRAFDIPPPGARLQMLVFRYQQGNV